MQVIRNHIVGSYIPELPESDASLGTLAALSTLESHTTATGVAVAASHTNVEAHVATGAGVQTCVGVVHSIDNVLVPNSILCSEPFGQCGGDNWRGPTCCAQKADQAYACETRDRFWASCRCAHLFLYRVALHHPFLHSCHLLLPERIFEVAV